MKRLDPAKLHIDDKLEIDSDKYELPRFYTLTHSDFTGELFLTIDNKYNRKQISGLYTKLMRDEVLAELVPNGDIFELKVHCHVSGGLVLGSAKWRYEIFHSELALAIEAIRYGDRSAFESNHLFDQAPVIAHFISGQKEYNQV
ncbi:MAG TPA: staygreen family protein [Dehalococcoidales bacterium]|nr:staygreen family protein [Dehalococcoidales bacterium]